MSLFDDVINDNPISLEATDEPEQEETTVVTEAVYPESLPYLKTMTRRITLPRGDKIGKGNLCFLYTNNTNESIEIINNKINFMSGNRYYYYYYNPIYRGRLYNKNYRIRELTERKELYKKIKTQTKVHPYLKMTIDGKDTRNMYYDLSRYIQIFNSLCSKIPPVKRVKIYWDYIKAIINSSNLSVYKNKFILINIEKFKLEKNLSDNLNNPVFMIYYSMYRFLPLLKDVNIDFYLYTDKKCLKVNPSQAEKKTYLKFKIEMKKLYSYVPNVDTVIDEDNIKKDEAVEDSIGKINESINKSTATEIVTNDTIEKPTAISSAFSNPEIYNKIKNKAEIVRREVEANIPNTSEIPDETISNVILTKVENDIDSDKELLSEIYDKTIAPIIPQSSASTARDKELKKAQENIKVGNMSIKEINKIQSSHINIPVKDVSNSVRTSNKNMTKIKFDNFEKTYNEKLMPKDITNAILALNNKSIPMYVRDIQIKDTSDELNYKDTYTIYLEDANRKRHTIKVDMPKFIEDKFLYIGGNRKLIKKQNLLYPVVKTSADIVQLTTNYNKMFIQRVGTKSISSIERLKNVLKKSSEFESYFTFGNSLSVNNKYVTTIEYDEISKIATRYKNGRTTLFFDQQEATDYASSKNISIPKGHMFIGVDKSGSPIFIDTNTQKTDDDLTIVDIILKTLNNDILELYNSTKAPKKLMYTRAKVMSQFVAVGLLLGFWEGLSSLLTKGKVKYRLEDKLPQLKPNENFLKFADCFLVYQADVGIDLLLNGYRMLDTSEYRIAEMDTKEPYMPYLIKVYGKATIANALLNVYEFMMDPITIEVCEDLNLPTDLVEIIIYAVSLLSDSQFTPEINQGLSRIRSNEIIPAILYERLAKKYILYRNSNGKKTFSVPQDCVIKEILALKTVEDYSTLNPVLEMEMSHGISSKGFRGANLDESYTMEKRTFDKTSTGVISPSTSPDGSVGVNKTLTMNPSVVSLRGYVELKDEKLNELHDTNLFSPGELSIPLAATKDDPTRLG